MQVDFNFSVSIYAFCLNAMPAIADPASFLGSEKVRRRERHPTAFRFGVFFDNGLIDTKATLSRVVDLNRRKIDPDDLSFARGVSPAQQVLTGTAPPAWPCGIWEASMLTQWRPPFRLGRGRADPTKAAIEDSGTR
jgi:hypothetical protein